MKTLVAIVFFALTLLPAIASADEAERYEWNHSLIVTADINRTGIADSAQLGISSDSVGLLLTVDSKPLPIIDIPIDGSKQFGICPGSAPSISVVPQSDAPLNALGETPRGYEICQDCVEIEVGGGECDSIHFYWDTTANELAWWRA